MRGLLAFLLGGTAVVVASSMAKKKTYAIGGRVPTANGEEFAEGGALSDLAGALKENFKDSKALGKKYSSKKKRKDLMKFKGKAWKEYGKDIVGMQVKDAKRKAKVIADNPEILVGKFSKGGYINSNGVNRLFSFLYDNRITAAAKTSEELGREYKLPKFQVEAIRRAVRSNYTLKEIHDMLRKMNN
jgi:hypothetical protein